MKMKNYLVESIVVTICCCLPFGIAAIVFAAQVNGKLQAGDIAGAQDAANKAKMFCWIGFGSSCCCQSKYNSGDAGNGNGGSGRFQE